MIPGSVAEGRTARESPTDIQLIGYGLHPPWSEGTRVLTRDLVRSLSGDQRVSVSCLSTIRRGEQTVDSFPVSYVRESIVGDLVDRAGGYRYNLDIPMLTRLAMRIVAAGQQADVIHAAFASHTIFSLITKLVTDAAFVAQTFGGIEHAGAAERLGTFDRVDAYVSSSYRDLETLAELGVPQEKLYSLNPPVFTGDFRSTKNENARAEFGIPEDDYMIGYLGNVNEQRFPRAIAERMETLASEDDSTVMVATKLIEDHPFADASGVKIIERHLDAREKRLFFQSCDVLVFPFNFPDEQTAPIIDPPLSVLEAMAAGRPIVTTDCLSLPELITDGVTGYVCERGDVDGIVDRLRRLAEQPAERTQVGTAARELVETRHSPQQAADRLIEVYDGVTNQ